VKIRGNAAEVEKVVRAVLRATRAITDAHNKNDVTGWIEKIFQA
jgi:hypothetical protein